jgi:hypothetical protein
MASIRDQVTLRTGVADWLNRTDLTDTQIDQFIEIAEARLYEDLRVPTLETTEAFSVAVANSSITIPAGFIEIIELKHLKGGTCSASPTTNTTRALCLAASGTWTDDDKDDDIVLKRIDSRAFGNNKVKNAYTRELTNFLITDDQGEQKASGEYTIKYYKAEDSIGTYATATTAATALVVDKYYKIAVAGNTTWTNHGAANSNVGTIFKATSVGSGTGTAYIETIPWILGTEYETILYAACTVGSTFIGDIEMEQKFNDLASRKIIALNDKEKRADLKGGIFTHHFSSSAL